MTTTEQYIIALNDAKQSIKTAIEATEALDLEKR